MSGFSIGFLYLCIFGMYALAFWYGTTLVIAKEIEIGDLTITFFGVLIASFSLGTVRSCAAFSLFFLYYGICDVAAADVTVATTHHKMQRMSTKKLL